MKEKRVKFSCSLDCFDTCSMEATIRGGKIIKIQGDPKHPLTKGFVCEKGKKHLERLYHTERILRPRKRIGDIWKDITWEEAFDEISEKLLDIKKEYGTKAVVHCYDGGYGGLSKTVDEMFFNYYGGVTVPRGSLCWGAGMQGQKYDFGDAKGHHPKDHLNAKNIIIWGRNPFNTNIHLMNYLTQANKNGISITLIDPIKTKTANVASEYISIKPSTDGALALGMANIIIRENLVDKEFIKKHVVGYEKFKKYVAGFHPKKVSEITGIDEEVIRKLAISYASEKPSCIILGYGLQRYKNGGNNIRCIDALGAITGNIGISGGGVNYANFSISRFTDGEVPKSYSFVKAPRSYSRAKLGEFLETANDPSIKCIFVTKTNPIVQMPNINRTMEAFKQIEFKVVIDMFMTDTAKLADLVLPCTSIMEEEDLVYSSMFSPYLNYSYKVVDPPEGIIGEYEFYRILAKKMNMTQYPDIDKEEFFKRAIKPLEGEFGVTLEMIKNGYFSIPDQEIPWKEKEFSTPSKKIEIYSERAKEDGLSPLPMYIPPLQGDKDYSLRLITPHSKNSLHSQHFAFRDDIPMVYLNHKTIVKNHLIHGGKAIIESKEGKIVVQVVLDENLPDNLLMIYEGWWHKSGSVNCLTSDGYSDMGEQATYYDCFCKIKPL